MSSPIVVQHCAQMHDDLQVFWSTNSSHIKIKQCGCISDGKWLTFVIERALFNNVCMFNSVVLSLLIHT